MNTVTRMSPTFFLAQFDRADDIKSMSQEASTLGLPPGQPPYGLLALETPPADIGLQIMNNSTGDVTTWCLTKVDMSCGDIAGWKFKPSADTIKEFPHLVDWTLLIVND